MKHEQRSGLSAPAAEDDQGARHDVPGGVAASYEGVIRRDLGAKGSGNRSWRSQDIPGRLSVEAGSSVGAGVGRWWRAATGCDPSALTRRALEAGSFWQNGAWLLGSSRVQGRGAPGEPRRLVARGAATDCAGGAARTGLIA